MQYTGGSLYQGGALDAIVAGLTGATGVEGVILSNQADFNTKNTAVSVKNTSQDNALSALETKAAALESGATGLEGRNTALDTALVVVQSREDALLAGLTGASGLENRAVGFNTNITAINTNLNGNIQEQINTKVADSIFQSLKTEFETDFAAFQNELNQKVVTATQEVLDARQDSDDAVLEKKFCSIEEFAQTFLQTYTVLKPDNTPYKFDGKIQKVDKAPPIFSIIEKAQNGSAWDLKVKLTDYGYNVMSGNLIVKGPTGTVLHTLTKTDFNSTTKLYALTLANSNSAGTLINGPYTFEYRASTNTAVYSLTLDSTVLESIPLPLGVLGTAAWGKWLGGNIAGAFNGYKRNGIYATSTALYMTGTSNTTSTTFTGVTGTKLANEQHGFVIKYNLDGSIAWGRWVLGSRDITNICANSEGIYILGSSQNLVTGVTGTKPTSVGNGNDSYMMRLDLNGNTVWGKWVSYNDGSSPNHLVISSEGVFFTRIHPTNYSFLLTKINFDGTESWNVSLGSTVFDILDMSIGSDGIYLTGNANNYGVSGISGAKVHGDHNGYIVKYNFDGTTAWGRWVGDRAGAVVASPEGVYVTGDTWNLTTLPVTMTGDISSKTLYGPLNYIIKYNKVNGDFIWGKWIGNDMDFTSRCVAISGSNLFIAGNSRTGIVTGLSVANKPTSPNTADSAIDSFLIKLDFEGNPIWGKWIGGVWTQDKVEDLVSSSDAVYISVLTSGPVTGFNEPKTSNVIIVKYV